jgi:hypothetical protein
LSRNEKVVEDIEDNIYSRLRGENKVPAPGL